MGASSWYFCRKLPQPYSGTTVAQLSFQVVCSFTIVFHVSPDTKVPKATVGISCREAHAAAANVEDQTTK